MDVKEIADMAIQGHISVQPNTAFPTISLPDNYSLKSLEPYQIYRNLFKGEFKTNLVDDFRMYCKTMDKESKNICFVSAADMYAKVIFDSGTIEEPEHCQHIAKLELTKTTPYKQGVLAAIKQNYNQRGIFNFLQDWKNYIQVVDSEGEDMETAIACQRILKIDITRSLDSKHEDGDFSSAKTEMAKIEAKAASGEKLPRGFIFTCQPYDSLAEYEFFLRLSLAQDHSGPSLKLRCEGLESLQTDMSQEFAELLKEEFGDNVLMGTFNPL